MTSRFRRTVAAVTGAVMLGGLAVSVPASAGDPKSTSTKKETKTETKTEKTQAESPQPKELKGKVLAVEEKTLWIEGEKGEAVPLRVTHETTMAGAKVKSDKEISSHLKKEFKPGDEVRASFDLRKESGGKYENKAVSVDKK